MRPGAGNVRPLMDFDRSRPPGPAEVRQCFFLRALEEADPAGERLTLAERIAATHNAAAEPAGLFIRARSTSLSGRLKGPMAVALTRALKERGGLPLWIGPAMGAAAFLIGWVTHDLGPDGRVSLLAFPLLGLLLWNLAVVIASLLPFKSKSAGSFPVSLPAWLSPPPAPTGDALTDNVVTRMERDWQAAAAPRLLAEGKLLFHIAALLLAAGVVAGMYARGLVRNYQAGWESTFLSQPAVSKLTRIVLGPASLLTGVPVPPVPPQASLSPAAPWIHLWAASAGLFIFLPRLMLISMTRREVAGKRKDWIAEFAEYETNVRRLAEGQPLVARVVPVQCTPDSPLRDSLRALLQHLWGGQVMVDFLPTVAYGGEDSYPDALTEPPTHLVLLLPMAVTPEDEVHGELHRLLEKYLTSAPRPPCALTVLDATSFEARLAGMPEAPRRMAERRAAWEKILGSAWPLAVLDAAARRNPAAAAAAVAAARQPLRLWTAAS